MRKPSQRELKVLQHFVGDCIEAPSAFPGVGKATFDAMVQEGWIVWVNSPATNEAGYRITEAGDVAAYGEGSAE